MSAVVEKVTEAAATAVDANTLASTSITDKDPMDLDDSQDPKDFKDTSTDAAVLASAAERRRLYIGNLAYATDEGELKEFFKGYLVETVFIPKNPRTERPVGYAFVDLSTPTEAERAIAELSGKEILERKVSVQLARTPEPEKKDVASNGENGENGTHRRQSTRGRGRPGRGRGGRARGGRGGSDENHIEGAVHGDDSQDAANGEVHALKDITNEKANENRDKGSKASRPPRERRERGPPADGIPSKTKVMVANLPYDLSEEKLKELFEAYSPLSAKIALRPIPRFMIKKLQARGERRKGRGFGFVTLESEELQLQAVAEMNGKEIEGREIAVKVAIDSPDKTDDDITAPIETKDDTPTATEEPAAPVEAAA